MSEQVSGQIVRAWFCVPSATVAIGEKRGQWEEHCHQNPNCVVALDGCHGLLVSGEFVKEYKGELVGSWDEAVRDIMDVVKDYKDTNDAS